MLKQIILAIFAITFFASCGQKSLNYDIKPDLKLESNKSCAVLAFTNHTPNIAASDALTSFFITELSKKNICKIVDCLEKDKKGDIKQTLEACKRQGIDYLFVGTITEYSYQYGLREDPAVGLSVKMINTSDSNVLWMADEGRVGRSLFLRDSLDATAIDSVKSVLSTLNTK